MTIEQAELLLDTGYLLEHVVAVADQAHLAIAHFLDLVAEAVDLVELAFAAVLSGNLVLATTPYVAYKRELRLAQVVLAQPLVELVHGQVDDVAHGYGHVQSASAFLVARQVLLGLAFAAFIDSKQND